MSNEIHKVLVVAYYDSSRDATFDVSTTLKESGYRIDICQVEQDKKAEDPRIQADLFLSKNIDLVSYKGVIFVDDGGNPKLATALAKAADEADLAVGGYSQGCEILKNANLLKDKFVCVGLPEEWVKGSDIVNSPTVRSDNIVTAAGNCAAGFATLMVDALGGQVHKQVEAEIAKFSERLAVQLPKRVVCASMQNPREDIERELGYQGIWMQPDGRLAMSEEDGLKIRTMQDAVRILRADLKSYLQNFREQDRVNDLKARMFSRLVRRTVLRLRLLQDLYSTFQMASSRAMIKTADYIFDQSESEYNYGDGTVPGPYSNVRVPERVIKWQEGDDWLHDIPGMDDQTIANLERYHPDSKEGFYTEFDLWHRNDPISWEDVEQRGEGDYPMREQLKH